MRELDAIHHTHVVMYTYIEAHREPASLYWPNQDIKICTPDSSTKSYVQVISYIYVCMYLFSSFIL